MLIKSVSLKKSSESLVEVISKFTVCPSKKSKESISVNIISTYLYSYSDLFPEFIKDTLTEYKQNNDEKKFNYFIHNRSLILN